MTVLKVSFAQNSAVRGHFQPPAALFRLYSQPAAGTGVAEESAAVMLPPSRRYSLRSGAPDRRQHNRLCTKKAGDTLPRFWLSYVVT